jgi:CubicO group peptidase (beta-lactamase class C family)
MLKWIGLGLLVLLISVRVARAVAFAVREDPCANIAQDGGGPNPKERGLRDLGPLIEAVRDKEKIPGMAAAVVSGGKLVALGATGVRKAGAPERVTIDDLWHLGSDTKAMTATLLATFVEEGKLKWGTTVAEAFPGVEMDDGWRDRTLAQLLQHRAGAPGGLDPAVWRSFWEFKGTPSEARMALVGAVLKAPPHAAGRYEYSNGGYAIAGAMAERLTGTAWEDLMRDRVFKPLGMSSVGFGAPGRPGAIEQPWGHHASGKPQEPGPQGDNPVAIGPAGIVHCSMEDWAKFIALHLRGARGEAGLLLKPETFRTLHEPGPGPGEKYAMGWLVGERPWAKGEGGTGRVLTHAGSNTMWFCVVWIAPEKDFAVMVACNQGGGRAPQACDQAVAAIIQQQLAAQPAPAEPPKP